jgi:hypothetical protein
VFVGERRCGAGCARRSPIGGLIGHNFNIACEYRGE